MNSADDFLNSFFKQLPQPRNGELSMEELNKQMAEYQRKMNNLPLEDFDGLSPEQMTHLLQAPLAAGGVLQFRQGMEDHVEKVPLFKLSEILLSEIQTAAKLKLTPSGNLPVRICQLLFNQKLILFEYMEYVNKRILEDDIPYLWPLKQYLLDEGIVKKRHNILSLTKNGEKFMQDAKSSRFINFLNYMTSRYHWGNLYDVEDGGKCGNLGWAYSLVLLSKYGGKPENSDFYSLKLIRAFEPELWDAHQHKQLQYEVEEHHHVYAMRFFERFANWFGLVNIERKKEDIMIHRKKLFITKSPLFDQLFEVRELH